jgi:hypothetical protein
VSLESLDHAIELQWQSLLLGPVPRLHQILQQAFDSFENIEKYSVDSPDSCGDQLAIRSGCSRMSCIQCVA